ncbi:7-carboxy-7-deazaguanine synthase QueE [soil metagenome]
MKISEFFYSIQGEGKRAGSPSFFIRTNFCNLRCSFTGGHLCDTPYTSWDPDDKKNIGSMEINEIVSEYEKYNCKDIVITGGEPAMQTDDLNELCKALKKNNPHSVITIETNGTYDGEYLDQVELLSVSPKLLSSTPFNTPFEKMHSSNRLNYEVLKKINLFKSENKADVQWKFVINDESDVVEIRSLQKEIGFKDEDVYLMPEGLTKEDLDKKRSMVVELCRKNQFNYTDRLHILIWGNLRGV